MPNVRKEYSKFQFTESTYWEHIFSLIPLKDEKLRKEVDAMIKQSVRFSESDQPLPEGEFTVTNRDGNQVTLTGEQLIKGTNDTPMYIPVDDPAYQRYFKNKLDLLDRIGKKYGDNKHETLKQEIGILRCKNQNLAEGLGYGFAPGNAIIEGTNGIQNFQKVLFGLEPEEKHGTDDRMKWTLKDPALVEKTMKEFGVTDIQRKYKEINEHNAEWAEEWSQDDRDPENLRKIGDKFKKDIKELDGYIKKFEKKYLADHMLPVDKRKIYIITNRQDDIEKHDVIIDFKHGGYKEGDRGINGRNWEAHKEKFAEEYERQLITAELDAISKDESIELPDGLMKKIDSYLGVMKAHFDMDKDNNTYKGNLFDTDAISGIRRLMDVRAEAGKTPDDEGAKMIIELADRHLKDPANARLVEKAKKINEKHTEIARKIKSRTEEAKKDGVENGTRSGIYMPKRNSAERER